MPDGGRGGESLIGVEAPKPPAPMKGDLIYFSDGHPRVLLGFDNSQNAVFAMSGTGAADVSKYPKDVIKSEMIMGGKRKSLEQWYGEYHGGDLADMLPSSGTWNDVMDRTEAGLKLREMEKRKVGPGKLLPMAPLGYLQGDVVLFNFQKYYFVGFDVADHNCGYVARMDTGTKAVDQKKVLLSDLFTDYDPKGVKPGEMAASAVVAPAAVDDPRYSHRNDQLARNEALMNREYYQAGAKIDGSVIQHAPQAEIMVVDFAKDASLMKFYDEVMADYEGLSPIARARISLPDYIEQEISRRVAYNGELTEGLLDGSLVIKMMEDATYIDKLDARIDRQALVNVMKLGPLRHNKIYVGDYLEMKAGVCRQMGVIAGACLERAIVQGRASGWVGVEIRGNMDFNVAGGHIWAVAKNEKGQEMIFDPAQRYYGPEERGWWKYGLGYEKHEFGKPGT